MSPAHRLDFVLHITGSVFDFIVGDFFPSRMHLFSCDFPLILFRRLKRFCTFQKKIRYNSMDVLFY